MTSRISSAPSRTPPLALSNFVRIVMLRDFSLFCSSPICCPAFLARRLGQTTRIGRILDSSGDYLLTIVLSVVYAVNRWIPVWLLVLVLLVSAVAILLPLLRGHILTDLILITLWTFNTFGPFLITGGGPAYKTDLISIYTYRTAFQFYEFGQGGAIAVVVMLINFMLALVYLAMLRKQAVYA